MMKMYKVVYNKQADKYLSFIVVKKKSSLNIKNQLIKGHNKDVIELDKSKGFSENILSNTDKLCASPGTHL